MSIERETGRSSNALVAAIQDRIDAAFLSANTIIPAKVKKFDSKTGFAEVALLTRQVFSPTDEKGTPASMPFPELTHVPVLFFGTKGVHVSAKVSAGDLGLCLFSQRSIDYFRSQMEREATERAGLSAVGTELAIEAPVNLRRFALEDAMFLPAYFAGGKEGTGEDNAIKRNKVNPVTGSAERDLAIGEVTDRVTGQKQLAVDKGAFKLATALDETNKRISENSGAVRAVASSGPATAASLPIVLKNTIYAKILEAKAFLTRKQVLGAEGLAVLFSAAATAIELVNGKVQRVVPPAPPPGAPLPPEPLFTTITPATLFNDVQGSVNVGQKWIRGFVLPGMNSVIGRNILGEGAPGAKGNGEADLSVLSADPAKLEAEGARAPDLRSWSRLVGLYFIRDGASPHNTRLHFLFAEPEDISSYVNRIIICRKEVPGPSLNVIAKAGNAKQTEALREAEAFVNLRIDADAVGDDSAAPDGGANIPFSAARSGLLSPVASSGGLDPVEAHYFNAETEGRTRGDYSPSPIWFLYFFDGDGEPLQISF